MKLKIHTQILIAIVLGVVAGVLFKEKTVHIKIVGDMFIRLLKAIIIPLIMASMVAGIVSLGDVRKLGRIGLKTFLYYAATTTLAVTVGLILVNVMKPGVGVEIAEKTLDLSGREIPSVVSIIRDIIPSNLFYAMAQDKARHFVGDASIFLKAVHCDRQRRGAAGCAKGGCHCTEDVFDKFHR